MTREEIHKLPYKAQLYINELERKLTIPDAVGQSEQLKDKKIKDLLNWVRSDIKQEENPKIGKTNTPYRSEKIKFLHKIEDILSL
jgi:hypothetical protein